jgi:hypothetical protein
MALSPELKLLVNGCLCAGDEDVDGADTHGPSIAEQLI